MSIFVKFSTKFAIPTMVFLVCGSSWLYIVNLKSTGARLIVDQLVQALEFGQISRIENLYCLQFTQTTGRIWYAQEFHDKAKPGAKSDDESGCHRKIVAFNTDRHSPHYIDDANAQLSLAETLKNAFVYEGDKENGPVVAAAYFYGNSSHKVYSVYLSRNKSVRGIASMFFVKDEWLVDQTYYVNLSNSVFAKMLFERYISPLIDTLPKP